MVHDWIRRKFKAAAVFLAMAALCVAGQAWSALPELIQRVKPSIVAVGSFDRTRSPAFGMRGTGFAVGSGNVIATNAHVIPDTAGASGNETLVVRIPAGPSESQQRDAKLIAVDKAHDLALLRIEGPPLPPLTIGGPVREGQEMIFIGFPIGAVLGMVPVSHRAMISAVTPIALPGATARQLSEKVIRRLKSGSFDIYQLDGTAYPGNSGGPLLSTETGEVVGIINMVFVKATKEAALSQPSGISFAIPTIHLQELLR